ncbi:MAG TPA: DNA-3-methyladenine glycosylase 2 family protein [Verrucomicrobiae bacterium]|nr:DNA-3-methyladenine glycosylase 2 family protein [Verrucomicrobiae bacterium]
MQRAETYLAQMDNVMAGLISEHGPCPLATRKVRPFHTLVTSIISQQLSSKAADTIEDRIASIVARPFQPDSFLKMPTKKLRSAGLSNAKAEYIIQLAEHVSKRRLLFKNFATLDDETVIASLMELRGIGRWTAEMFLIFGLKRPDVLALSDAGLQRAARLLYGQGKRNKNLLSKVAEGWRPYRSVASWFLWKYLDATG